MTGLEQAILGLEQAVNSPRRHRSWRWLVRQRMAGVRDALTADRSRAGDAWLAAREDHLRRERTQLLGRLTVLGAEVLDAPDVEPVRQEIHRLVQDLEHHRQRVNDLVYDTVAMEIGGSE